MSTPLPPQRNPVAILAAKPALIVSDFPAAVHWLINPGNFHVSRGQRERWIETLLEFLLDAMPPPWVVQFREEVHGMLPSEALAVYHSHLDDRLPYPFPYR